MRTVLGTLCLTLGLMLAASPVLAGINGPVPAPLVGFGVPAMLVVGGILIAGRLFKSK
jgi:hypothetical protein